MKELCDVLKECYRRGWITTRDGNASFRKEGHSTLLITPSGVVKHSIKPKDILKLNINAVDTLQHPKASGEIRMHYILHRNAPGDVAVLHAHPTHTIAAMYAGWNLQYLAEQFPEIYRYTKVGSNVPVLEPLTPELAFMTHKELLGLGKFNNIVGQDRHGATALGKTPWEAFEHMERLEHICEIVLKSGKRK